jgi:hypothetical protein
MKEVKIKEVRPEECNTRIGDAVVIDGVYCLKVKCRRCSKTHGIDVFHYVSMSTMSVGGI